MFVVVKRPEHREGVESILHPEISSDLASTVEADTQTSDTENRRTQAAQEIEPETSVRKISLPQVYEDHIRPRQRQVLFADIHYLFKNESRDEPWAAAMESGIIHYIANSGSGNWAVVDYIECRSGMCEIAGQMTGKGNNPRRLVDEFLNSGIWQGEPRLHSSRFSEQDFKRFIIVISSYSDEEYRSALSFD